MIGKLKGKLDQTYDDHLIIDVGGVGYMVQCSSKTLNFAENNRDYLSLIIETMVREDAITLFGFKDEAEKNCFKSLLTVKGVGGKLGMQILSYMNPNDILLAITNQEKSSFMKVPGVGGKLAERIIIELKGKNIPLNIQDEYSISNDNSLIQDAVSALANLGYNKNDALLVVKKHTSNNNMALGELIRMALKELAR